jgi:hypothetical protein
MCYKNIREKQRENMEQPQRETGFSLKEERKEKDSD